MNKTIIACTAFLIASLGALALWQNTALNTLSERLERVERSAGLPATLNETDSNKSAPEEGDDGLTRRLAKLERAMSVRQDLGALPASRRVQGARTLSGVAASDDFNPDTNTPGSDAVAPQARAAVKDLVRNELKLRDDERFEKRKARQLERLVERIETLAEANDIDPQTRGKMVSIMSAEREQISSFWREAREGNMTRKDAHTRMSETRTETDSNMESILDDDQFAAYEKDRDTDRHGPRRDAKAETKKDEPKTETE